MFSTKCCFEKRNKNDRSPCLLKRCEGSIFFNLCLPVGTRANHVRYSSVQVIFEVGGYIVYSTNHLGKNLTGRRCPRAYRTISYEIWGKITPFKTTWM